MLVIGNKDVLVLFPGCRRFTRKLGLHSKCRSIQGDHVFLILSRNLIRLALYDGTFKEVRFTDELRHELGCRTFIDFKRRSDLKHVSLIHDCNAVADSKGLTLIVGDIYERNADFIVERIQIDKKVRAEFCIQSRKRFVQKEHLGFVYQCPGDCHTLPLTAGKLIRFLEDVLIQLNKVKVFAYLFIDDGLLELYKKYGLDAQGIYAQTKEFVEGK